MAALVLLGFFVLLSVLALTGKCADSRDPEYSLGRVLAPRPASGEKGR